MAMTEKTALEGIPHLCKKICAIWGSPELEAHVNTLIMDSRDGTRSGFPMDVAAELLWLVELNKLRRAMEMSSRLKISLADAHLKLNKESASGHIDAWGDPSNGGRNQGRRYADKPQPVRPHRRHDDNTAGGIVYRAITNRFFLLAIILILALKIVWPYITALR